MSIEDHNDVERLSVQFNIFLKGLYAIPLNLPGTTFYKAIRATNVIRKELLQFVRKRRKALEQKTASPLSYPILTRGPNGVQQFGDF